MTTSTSLIDLIMSLLKDPAQREAFQQDPEGFLASCGDISPEDVKDAIDLADDRDSDSGSSGGGNHIQVPPAHHVQPHPGESDHEAAVRYLNTYITNNYSIDDRDTTIDNSLHQDIDNRGGVFDQDITNTNTVASGDGAVAAGDDIDGTVTTGDGNQVGDGNVSGHGNVVGDNNQAVTGDDDTTSFGAGSASSVHGGVTVGAGGAFSGTGDATTDNTDNSVSDSFNDQSSSTVADSFNDQSDSSTNTDSSSHDSFEDDHQVSSHTESSTDNSFNTEA